MFEHSVKVPRVYKLAGNIIRQVKEEGGSLKSLVFQEKNQKNNRIQALFALVVETVKHESHLNDLFTKTGLLVNEPRLDPWLARVLLTEVLWGKQKLSGESKPVKIVLQYLDQCKKLTESLCGKLQEVDVKKVLKPRYIRINSLHLTAADAVRNFQDEGWNLVRCTSGSYDDYLKQVENLGQYDFLPDYHVKVVFAFAPNTPFYDCPLYHNGEIFLQDKATCLAAFLLSPTPGSTVLDMCAAPGMKTTHLAAVMKNEGTIYSVEQDEQRYKVLCQFVESSGATCVKVLNKDVATIKKDDCPNVDYILLDPSCSGSGINRAELNDLDYDLDSGRVGKLAAFQAKLLRHALNEFRTATRVVYSTCSLYPQENEEVIKDVIRSHKGKFRLVSVKERLNNNWNNVGDAKYDIGDKCLYARPESDYTSGFFLAMFERVLDAEGDNAEIKMELNNKLEIVNVNSTIESSTGDNRIKKRKDSEIGNGKYEADCIKSNVGNSVQYITKRDKKESNLIEECQENDEILTNEICKKKKKKSNSQSNTLDGKDVEEECPTSKLIFEDQQNEINKTKKKKKKESSEQCANTNESELGLKRKKDINHKTSSEDNQDLNIKMDLENVEVIKTKKKKKTKSTFDNDSNIEQESSMNKKSQKRRNNIVMETDERPSESVAQENDGLKKSKRKKLANTEGAEIVGVISEIDVCKKTKTLPDDGNSDNIKKKKRDKNKFVEYSGDVLDENVQVDNPESSKKKKKKKSV